MSASYYQITSVVKCCSESLNTQFHNSVSWLHERNHGRAYVLPTGQCRQQINGGTHGLESGRGKLEAN